MQRIYVPILFVFISIPLLAACEPTQEKAPIEDVSTKVENISIKKLLGK